MFYKIIFSLNDGEVVEVVSEKTFLRSILRIVLSDINKRYPDWKWNDNGWADICRHDNGDTYIRIRGVGDVRKGQTYYIIHPIKE